MKNLIFILIFLIGFLSNNTVFAVASKATYSETQTIRTIPKQKKLSYLEKVFTKKIEKIAKNDEEFKEIISIVVRYICGISMSGLFLGLLALMICGIFAVINIDLILIVMGISAVVTIVTVFILTVILGEELMHC